MNPAGSPKLPPDRHRRHTVLVVDDEPDVRDYFEAVLLRAGFDPLLAAGGEEALSVMSGLEVDAVLLDLNMPGMDGQETLERMLELRPGLPVLMVTASNDVEQAARAVRAGAVNYLVKPAAYLDLLNALERALAAPPARPA